MLNIIRMHNHIAIETQQLVGNYNEHAKITMSYMYINQLLTVSQKKKKRF